MKILDTVEAIIALAEKLDADRLELANAQFHGFAFENRAALMPSRERSIARNESRSPRKTRLAGKMDVLFVKPDYFSQHPRACMDGWARRFVQVIPDGTRRAVSRGVHDHVARRSIARRRLTRSIRFGKLLRRSTRFVATRGCRSRARAVDRKAIDFGGCRCQAFALIGDAARTDPACTLSPDHALIRAESPRRFLFRGKRA